MKNQSKPKENQYFWWKTKQNLRKTNKFTQKPIKTLGKPMKIAKNCKTNEKQKKN